MNRSDRRTTVPRTAMTARRQLRSLAALAGCVSAVLTVAPARSDEVSDFYAGRTVQLVVGYATGGGYDDYARMLGRHIGRH